MSPELVWDIECVKNQPTKKPKNTKQMNKLIRGPREIVKRLLLQHKGPSLIPNINIKFQMWWHAFVIPLLGRQGQRIPGAFWPVSLAYFISPRCQ